jgi:hypothetical protein
MMSFLLELKFRQAVVQLGSVVIMTRGVAGLFAGAWCAAANCVLHLQMHA